MDDFHRRIEADPPAVPPEPVAPFTVLTVKEELLVENPGLAERAGPCEEKCAADPPDIARPGLAVPAGIFEVRPAEKRGHEPWEPKRAHRLAERMRKFPADVLHRAVAVAQHAAQGSNFRVRLHDFRAMGDAPRTHQRVAVQQHEIIRRIFFGHLLVQNQVVPAGEPEVFVQRPKLQPSPTPAVLADRRLDAEHRVVAGCVVHEDHAHVGIRHGFRHERPQAVDCHIRRPEIQDNHGESRGRRHPPDS